MSDTSRPWWKDAVFYQIYPRSFQDTNGDGLGDIPGIISRLDALAKLGVTALWLSPLYPSPDADNGYDIADYCDIDPRYGTLDDFDKLVAQAGKLGIRVIIDLVVNHTSDEHPWFQASRRREAPYTDYYIWRPAKEDGKPPNNWTGFFMGSTWQWDDLRGEYYLHLFDRKQPDLNWHNPAVIAEVKKIMNFWLDRGVAGFRCDVVSMLYKTSLDDGKGGPLLRGIEHYKAQEGNHEILRELHRDVLGPRGAFTVGEAGLVTLQEAHDLSDVSRAELDLILYFDHLEADRIFSRYGPKPFSAAELLRRFGVWQKELDWNALYLESHDQPRIVSHYGDDKRFWARSAKLLAVLLLTLRGTPFLYQGQELGMTNGDFTSLDQLDDVESHNVDAMLKGFHVPRRLRWWLVRSSSRDNARTPVQWDATPGAGFTTGTPWLQANPNASWLNYAAQTDDPDSVLNFYREVIKWRKGSAPILRGDFAPVFSDRSVLAFSRTTEDGQRCTIWLNMSGHTRRPKPLGDAGEVAVSNVGRTKLDGTLQPWEALVVAG